MDSRARLLEILSDGHLHEGARLARRANIVPGSLEREIDQLRTLGLDIAGEPQGYRLAEAIELLQYERIMEGVSEQARPLLRHLEVLHEVDSTNRYLMDAAGGGGVGGVVCFAEAQTAGRGRRGRHWHSPFGQNLYLSVLWRFECDAQALQGLSLALGVAVAEALDSLGTKDLKLKWPNDLYWHERKLGGLLIEVVACGKRRWHVVAGCGLNIDMEASGSDVIEQPWVNLRRVVGSSIGRNRVAGIVLGQVLIALERFAREGFESFRDAWARRDLLCDKGVSVEASGDKFSGRAMGIDAAGHLLVEVGGAVRRISSGDVSVRTTPV